MGEVSQYIDKNLQPLFKNFISDLEAGGIFDALQQMKEYSGFSSAELKNKPETFLNYICDEYGVGYNEGVFFMQECGREVADHYSRNCNDNDRLEVLTTIRDTNIPTEMKEDLCIALTETAISKGDNEMLEVACLQSDGMPLLAYEEMKADIEETFGHEEALKLELAIQTKDNMVLAAKGWEERLHNGDISTDEYLTAYASMIRDMPETVKESLEISISTEEIQNGMAFLVNPGIAEDEQMLIPIGEEELSIQKDDALELIQNYKIKGDNALDVICEVNLPPTNPNFASELAQKFSNYVSSQAMAASEANKGKQMVSSVLPDDQRATFESFTDDIMKEQRQQVQGHLNANDRDYDGVSDIRVSDEYEESTEYAVPGYDEGYDEEDMEL